MHPFLVRRVKVVLLFPSPGVRIGFRDQVVHVPYRYPLPRPPFLRFRRRSRSGRNLPGNSRTSLRDPDHPVPWGQTSYLSHTEASSLHSPPVSLQLFELVRDSHTLPPRRRLLVTTLTGLSWPLPCRVDLPSVLLLSSKVETGVPRIPSDRSQNE